jgi:hypothetical protein
LSQICHLTSSDLTDIIGNHVPIDEKTRLLDSLNHIRSQLVLISSKPLLTSEGYLV